MEFLRARFLAVALSAAVCTALTNLTFADAPITTYTQVAVNSPTALYFSSNGPTLLQDNSGADTMLNYSGTHSLAYSHYDGPPATYTVIPTTDIAFASASLATGQLKVHSLIGLGTATSGAPFSPGINNTDSDSSAAFADSFTTYSGNTPFLWQSGTQATLHLAISGTTSIPGGFTSTDYHQYAYTLVQAYVYKPGTLDLINQANNFDFSQPNATALYQALENQVTANTIATASWYIGNPVVYFGTGTIPIIDPSTNPTLDFTFTPGGDFQFYLAEQANIHLDAASQNTTVDEDYSHTINTTYTGPAGTTTYSASGLFPGTLSDAILTPEPASLTLLAVASLPLLYRRRRCAC